MTASLQFSRTVVELAFENQPPVVFGFPAETVAVVLNPAQGIRGGDGLPGVDGVDGAAGAPGSNGADGLDGTPRYEHIQSSPSAAWVINHGLGFYPSVTLLTAGGLEFEGLVLNTSLNQVSVQLNQAQGGRAILQ